MNRNRIIRISALALCCLLFGGMLHAQHYVGFRGGYGGGNARIDPVSGSQQFSQETGFLVGFPSAGLAWKYYSPTIVVGAIEVDLQYARKGWKEFEVVPRTSDEEHDPRGAYRARTLDVIEMPFMWQPHVYVGNRSVRLYLNLGVYVSYFLSSTVQQVDEAGNKGVRNDYSLLNYRDNRWEYGLLGGFGVSVLVKRFDIFAEARYSFGYSDVYKNHNKYEGNPLRSPVDMINISVGVFYRLGKGGLLAPPASKKNREN